MSSTGVYSTSTITKLINGQIIVTDANNNKSVLKFQIKSQAEKPQPEQDIIDNNIKVMPYNKANKFSAENISISIPAGALYDTLYFSYKKELWNK
jgi:hypothetical protein